jgi:G:T-mismatch repair DNA endonuclease (very short patch repair protein)
MNDLGWSTMVVWQCELADAESTFERVREFLDN